MTVFQAITTGIPSARLARHHTGSVLAASLLLSCTALTSAALADAAPPPTPDAATTDEIVVTGSLNALPIKDVGSIFGFNKTLVETPRSASTISKEQLDRFGITQIYDLVAQVPGTFTSSFFGTGGALDIRGAPSDVYFRGMLRLDNPGNYATPIGAADRIDIVRGPASVIYGPSKIGGYMNFVPKTARAENGTYAAEAKGDLELDLGSWGRKVLKGSITGPGSIGGHKFGYSLYGEVEDSDSYYRYVKTKNALFSAAFDTDITSSLRTEFGYTYQKYDSVQNSGWNRLTQDLIDHGTYITGQSRSVDTNGDGKISNQEGYAANGGPPFGGLTIFGSFGCGGGAGPSGYVNNQACVTANYPDWALLNPGTTHLSMKDTLTGPDDKNNNIQNTAYFDLIYDGGGDLKIKNQLFYDGGKNLNENAYGFSQAFKSYVLEDKIILSDSFKTDFAKISVQASPSLRYTHFHFADDFGNEYWNRPDISQNDIYQPYDTRLLSTQIDSSYSDYVNGHYTDLGMAGLVDIDSNIGFDFIGGVRYDSVHSVTAAILSKYDPAQIGLDVYGSPFNPPIAPKQSDTEGGWSWNASLSYKSEIGLVPYVTVARQTTVVAGEGSELYPINVLNHKVLGKSNLLEGGIKGEFLDKKLYAAVSVYKQKRVQAGAESNLTNQILQTKGIEAELRWSVDRHLLVTAAFTHIKVINIGALIAGSYFNYFGAGDLVGVNPTLIFGGSQTGNIPIPNENLARRPGEPANVGSATATYAFDNGIALSGDISHVDAVYANYTQTVKLPAYWLLNLGASFTTGPWLFRAELKNANNARYFRAGGQDLFGADIALPQLPRSWQATIKYKF